MNIIVCYKYAPDAKDIELQTDGSVSLDRAEWVIGEYDFQALEAAVKLVEAVGGKVMALSVGTQKLADSGARKEILARGADELYLVEDDALQNIDTHLTARILAAAINKIDSYDMVICGEGSSDLYFQQVGLQLGQLLNVPVTNSISMIAEDCKTIHCQRSLEDEIEVVDIPLPAVISVTADFTQPRLPSMKEMLKAKKKPVIEWSLKDIDYSGDLTPKIKIINTCSPRQIQSKDVIMFPVLMMLEMKRTLSQSNRKQTIISGEIKEAVHQLVDYLNADGVLKKE